ncbi:hypothetical protein PR202_gb24764 [Eleusine coracana subsp. coracana]|uniref:RING-type E3 ubiquitin transferase n=1 Tax=Eleusine coracana subsp. coracana TaxID=191504 RepID=A0AAV5FMH3_ELECO|nr:hypothetical protein PR202_gb24764 [Eleusine coracana subsp. coracana]
MLLHSNNYYLVQPTSTRASLLCPTIIQSVVSHVVRPVRREPPAGRGDRALGGAGVRRRAPPLRALLPPPAPQQLRLVLPHHAGDGGVPTTTRVFTYQVHAASNGLDAKALRALPVFRWESKSTSSSQAADAEPTVRCAVCLGHMVDGELGRLLPACRHVFHAECIDKWFGTSTTCPICRTTAAAAGAASSLVRK